MWRWDLQTEDGGGGWQRAQQVAEEAGEVLALCTGEDGRDLLATVVEGFIVWPLGPGGVCICTVIWTIITWST